MKRLAANRVIGREYVTVSSIPVAAFRIVVTASAGEHVQARSK